MAATVEEERVHQIEDAEEERLAAEDEAGIPEEERAANAEIAREERMESDRIAVQEVEEVLAMNSAAADALIVDEAE